MDGPTEWPVVAGVDGSDTAVSAVGWAAREADRRGRRLRLVAAVPWAVFRPIGVPAIGQERARDAALQLAAAHLTRAREEAARTLPEERIEQEVRAGNPAEVLHEESARSGLLVLGNRGRGGFTGLLAGSVGTALAATAACPVVVFRGTPAPDGPVVVGISGSPDGEAALGFALEEARSRGAELVAVHACSDEVFDPAVAALLDRATLEERQTALLSDTLASWREKYPEVRVRPRLALDSPAAALVGESAAAQLVVVGSRGHGAVAGLLLGSVSRPTMHHSRCPVAVVRHVAARPSEM